MQWEKSFTPLNVYAAKEAVQKTLAKTANRWVGNPNALRILSRALFAALQRDNHAVGDFSYSLIGPPSTGKTTLVQIFAEWLEIPLVVIQPQMLDSVNDILYEIAKVCQKTKAGTRTLELQKIDGDRFILPAMIVFIDEVHALKNGIVQGLLKAIEAKDRTLVTEKGWYAKCHNVCWMVATTDRGLLFDALDSRFTKIPLNLYTVEEMGKIVKINFPQWPMETCLKVAKIGGRVPREVIALAKDVCLEQDMSDEGIDAVIETVREEHGIDKYGMTHQRFRVLSALGQGPIAKNRLGITANCKQEELERYVMPPLLTGVGDEAAPVTVTSKGYTITDVGLAELDKRGIEHKGQEAQE